MYKFPFLSTAIYALLLFGCDNPNSNPESNPAADRVFLNGAIYTVEEENEWAEAVAITDGIISYVGGVNGAKAWIGENTLVTDLEGQMLLPGFHDSHTHVLIGVATDTECDLIRIEALEEVYAKLGECTSLKGFGDDNWILGSGWTEWLWENSEPDKAILDELFPNRPVYLRSSFGHSGWVNSKAMELAGITKDTDAGIDGVVVMDPETGEPTGTLHDGAMLLVKNILPEMTDEHRMDSVRASLEMIHTYGITAVIEPGLDAELIAPLVQLSDAAEFNVRALASLSTINWQPGIFDDAIFEFLESREQWRRPNLDVDSVKIYMDGVIESKTGHLLEPYSDPIHGVGPKFYSQEDVNRYFTQFDSMGLQIHVHAIGDAGIRIALNGYEAAIKANGPSDNRHHMTHLQLIHEEDIPRFGEYNVGATFQPLWAYYDPSAVELDIPAIGEERTHNMYSIGSVHRAGGRINGASDFFVTDINPLLAIEVAMTRQNPYSNSGRPLKESERVDLATMIRAYTINGAYTMGLENLQGTIKVGKRADLTVLNRNLFDITPYEISDTYVTETIFDGKTVYKKIQ
ncbi:MAG: amidohydrolase [Emcibacteraceae bacterium]|nr:amidohydrolase [Emcibacteraceae bacterium]